MDEPETKHKSARSPELRRAIAAKGGAAVPPEKRTFSDRERAAAAGRKGGPMVAPENRAFSRNRQLASDAGRKGGLAAHGAKKSRPAKECE